MATMRRCRWCNRPETECYMHCHKSEDGKHQANPYSAQAADQLEFAVDYTCKLCGITGGVKIDPNDIYWE
jgi:hypothetical protein